MKVTKADMVGLAALVDVLGAYGRVTDVDDELAHLTVELAGVAYRFLVEDGNVLGVDEHQVMLLSVRGPDARVPASAVFVEETAGSYAVPPRVAERIVSLFHGHGVCQACQADWHTSCRRQAADGTCRCRCSVHWALSRVRATLGPLPDVTRAVSETGAVSEAATSILLPRRALQAATREDT
ncbi:hypothetical protein ACQEVC_34225 [Plantactinospora sp. CA-294935]|uniref:hypothetical protein n=1 Tax=Plantactinospora sp. CA-294935 TaxID=3240012 RepID=UPI003D91E26B